MLRYLELGFKVALGSNPAGRKTRYSLKCQSSWRALAQLQHESSSVLLAGMENRLRGRSLSLSFRMESTTDGSRIGLIMPKAGWTIRLSQSKESLVDETGIEPATSSLRTVGKIS